VSGTQQVASYLTTLVNSALLHALRSEAQLRASVTPLEVRSDSAVWPASWRGTAFLADYNDRQFCVFTLHQLGSSDHGFEFDPANIGVQLGADPKMRFSCSRVTWRQATDGFNSDNHDIAAIELTWAAKEEAKDSVFFGWSVSGEALESDDALFVVGYPRSADDFTIGDAGELQSVLHKQVLLEVRSVQEILDGLSVAIVETHDASGGILVGDSFDGLSGSPIFRFRPRDGKYHFHGMVVRGGSGTVRYLPAKWIEPLLIEACKHPPAGQV
jgi:hypothetical protein